MGIRNCRIILLALIISLLVGCNNQFEFDSIDKDELFHNAETTVITFGFTENDKSETFTSGKAVISNTTEFTSSYSTIDAVEEMPKIEEDKRQRKYGVDVDGLTVVREYEVPIIGNDKAEILNAWKKKNEISDEYCDYCIINKHIVYSGFSGEWIGNTQTANLAIDCGDRILEIEDVDFLHSSNPIYFIEDNVFYAYDYGVVAGLVHVYFVEFSLNDANKINEYNETYELGSEEIIEYTSTYPNIENVDELQSYIYNLSPQWYKCKNERWSDLINN